MPTLAERTVRERITALAARAGVEVELQGLWVRPLEGLTITGLRARAQAGAAEDEVRFDRVDVAWHVAGLRSPKIHLQRVDLRGGVVRASRRADGSIPWLEAWTQLRGDKSADDGGDGQGGGGLRRYLARTLPSVHVERVKLALNDASGPPLLVAPNLDARHLRAQVASFDWSDRSPVVDGQDFVADARIQVTGVAAPITCHGELKLPDRTGSLQLTMAEPIAIEAAGLRASLGGVELDSELHLVLRDLSLGTADANAPLSLDVRRLQVGLVWPARPESALPEALRGKLPAIAQLALRHVEEIRLEDAVLVGQRAGGPDELKDDDAVKASAKDAALLPRASAKTEGESKTAAPPKPKPAAAAAPEPAEPKEAPLAPGEKVRTALASLFDRSATGLERGLERLRTALAAMPVQRIVLVRGRARYRDERPRAGAAGEVSDFAAHVERLPDGVVTLDVSFAADRGTKDAKNEIKGRVATATGDASLDIRLDALPLSPWGAVLPSGLRVHPDSRLRDTKIAIRYDAKARAASVDGKLHIDHFDVAAARIARHIIADLQVRASGKLLLDLAHDKLAFADAEFGMGRATAMVSGTIERFRKAPLIDMTLRVPSLACQDAVDSLVGPLAPMLAGARCKGSMSFRVEVGLDTAKMSSLRFEFEPTLRNVVIESMGNYIDFDVLRGPFEHHARQKDGSLYSFVTGPGSARWTHLGDIAPTMAMVVTTTEDGSFFWHKGFSLLQIRDAMVANLEQGRFVRGASTMSQQVVKNLFFVEREKTLSRKIQEAVVTWELEHRFSKEEILALYFNIIEFGPQIYGIRAASNHYFNRAPSELTLLQSIWIGSIIPNPRAFYHHFTKGEVSESWRKTLCWIADVMVKREKIDAETRARLGDCNVVFGGGPDGSERPADPGLGHEDAWDADAVPPPSEPVDPDAPLPPPADAEAKPVPAAPTRPSPAPSVRPEDQP